MFVIVIESLRNNAPMPFTFTAKQVKWNILLPLFHRSMQFTWNSSQTRRKSFQNTNRFATSKCYYCNQSPIEIDGNIHSHHVFANAIGMHRHALGLKRSHRGSNEFPAYTIQIAHVFVLQVFYTNQSTIFRTHNLLWYSFEAILGTPSSDCNSQLILIVHNKRHSIFTLSTDHISLLSWPFHLIIANTIYSNLSRLSERNSNFLLACCLL